MAALYHNVTSVSSIEANTLHIDTIKIGHAYRNKDLPLLEGLLNKGFELNHKQRKNLNKITTAHLKPNNLIPYHLTIIKSDYGYCGVNIELSLAKFLDNSGLGEQTNDDIDCAFESIDYIIKEQVNVEFDSRTAKVGRLDVNADFPVGEDKIQSYINAISRPNSRFTPAEFGETTKQFYNKSRKLLVYGKYKEVEHRWKKGRATDEQLEMAKGLLRVEVGLRKPPIDRLAKKLNISAEASHLINLTVARQIVSEGLHQLSLDMPRISDDALYRELLKHFGKDAPYWLGIIKWKEKYGDDFWRILGWSQSKYYKKKRELETANLWNVVSDEELQALELTEGL